MSTKYLLAVVCLLPLAAQDPPCQIGTVVRAGALNYDARIVEFNAGSGMYKVEYVKGYKGDTEWLPPSGLKTCKAGAIAPVSPEWFQGVWQLNKGGGGAWQKNPSTGSWRVTGLDVAGAPPVRLSAGGTFEWVISATETIRGRWRPAQPSEWKYGYDRKGTVMLLEKGEFGQNWLVTRDLTGTADGRDRIALESPDGLSYRGNRVGAAAAAAPAAPAGLTPLTKGNAALAYDPAVWSVTPNADGFRFLSKDEKAFAILMTDPAQRTPAGFLQQLMENMSRGGRAPQVVARRETAMNGLPTLFVRMEVVVSGNPYTYLTAFQANAGGGAALITFTTPANYASREASLVALINTLHLQ
jgi:hypothetical protein